jgi:Ankyrin repeats (many copies)
MRRGNMAEQHCISQPLSYDTVVRMILDGGADVNIRDNDGETVLHRAANRGHDTIHKTPLDRGTGMNMLRYEGSVLRPFKRIRERIRNPHSSN